MLKEMMLRHRWVKRINESDLSLLLKNNTLISLKGADNDQSLRGVGLNFIVLDEFADIKPQAWYEVLRPTLSDTLGHALFCSSPKDLILLMIYIQKDPEWQSFKYTTLEGGQVSESEIEQAKNDLDERTFQQEYLATFVNYAVSSYNFDRNKNIIDSYKKKFKTIHVGQDFNIDPMVAVVSVIENDKIFIIDEYKYFLLILTK